MAQRDSDELPSREFHPAINASEGAESAEMAVTNVEQLPQEPGQARATDAEPSVAGAIQSATEANVEADWTASAIDRSALPASAHRSVSVTSDADAFEAGSSAVIASACRTTASPCVVQHSRHDEQTSDLTLLWVTDVAAQTIRSDTCVGGLRLDRPQDPGIRSARTGTPNGTFDERWWPLHNAFVMGAKYCSVPPSDS